MVARTKLMALEEFLAPPEEKPYLELIDGEVGQKPVGTNDHANAQSELGTLLRLFSRHAGGKALVEAGVIPAALRANFRVPDVVYYAAGSEPAASDVYSDHAPTLAAEVRSVGQTLRSLRERLAFLREHGTICTLLVDPEARTVEVHDAGREWTASAGDSIELSSLPGFSFEVDSLFA